jgi:hypothetical protein
VTRLALGAAFAALVAATGCGVGAGSKPSGVTLTVQRDFGFQRMGTAGTAKIHGSDTVMRLLERSFKVKTRYGGRFVQAVGGVAGGTAGGRPVDWFYYVNGLEAPRGAADTGLRSGDHVIWDFHDWGATQDVPAIVGSFPEPFLHGSKGKRYPVRLECAPGAGAACDLVAKRMSAVGVSTARGTLGSGSEIDSYRILVGTFAALRADPAEQRLARGLPASGVYAIPRAHGRRLVLLDARGRMTHAFGPGTGLVAAVRPPGSQPVWLVTGTDAAGVKAAAFVLTPRALAGRFAALITAGNVTGLPEPSR